MPDLLLVTELFPPAIGGSGELLNNIYGRLSGLSVTVLTDLSEGASASESNDFRVLRMRMGTRQWGILHGAGLRQHLRSFAQVRRHSRRTRTVVHCGRALPEGLSAWLSWRLGGSPYVCWTHGEELAYVRKSRELTWLMRRVQRDAAALLANSKNTAHLLAQALGVPRPIDVVYPGVDTDRFRPGVAGAQDLRRRLLVGPELLLLTVGRLERRKGHDLVLQALAHVKNGPVRFRYVVVGTGPEEERLVRMAGELGVQDRVNFEGKVPTADLPAYYAAADLFVHPNRIEADDFEGFGIVFLEAAAAGLAVIGGATGGAPEAVAHAATGWLVSGTSVDELSHVLVELGRSPERRRAMGEAGRLRAQREFSWDRAAEQVRAIHERAGSSAKVHS